MGDLSRTLEGNSRKRSESVSGVFPEFFWSFFRKVAAVLGVWPIHSSQKRLHTIRDKIITYLIFIPDELF